MVGLLLAVLGQPAAFAPSLVEDDEETRIEESLFVASPRNQRSICELSRLRVDISHPAPPAAERRINQIAPARIPCCELDCRNGLGAPLLL